MAFDNVTLFEVHLDGANIGPAAGTDDTMDEERVDGAYTDEGMEMEKEMDAEMDEASAGRRGRGPFVAVVALVAVVGAVAVLRHRRGGEAESDEGIEIESVADGEAVEAVEQ